MLLALLALLVIAAILGAVFVVKWLFIVAAILALLWIISLFVGGIEGSFGRRRV
jgi:hypothetical protein